MLVPSALAGMSARGRSRRVERRLESCTREREAALLRNVDVMGKEEVRRPRAKIALNG